MTHVDDYYELRIEVNPQMSENLSEIISDMCFENFDCDGIVFAEEAYTGELELVSTTQGTLKLYLKSDKNVEAILRAQRESLLNSGFSEDELGSWKFSISPVENEDWSKKWKENWEVTHVSDKIAVVPSWLDYSPSADEIVIDLDPGSAFGTGTHATTQLCMLALEKYLNVGDTVADIGMGSGILSVCALKLGAKAAYGCDNDELVIETAVENAKRNNVYEKCQFEYNTADKVSEQFDFVCANILHYVLTEIMGDLKALMKDDAKLSLSGILDEKRQMVIDAIEKHNLKIIDESHQDIWVGFVVEK